MKRETPRRPDAVIVVSSHVARGGVGNRAAVFALETLGFPVWAVPTVILPWHPGHGPATRIVPDGDAFDGLLSDLAAAHWLGEVGGILSGYLGEAGQAGAVARLVAAVRAKNPRALYLCDPVIGDAGGLYVPQATAEAIRDRLFPIADLASPNLFELQWLTGQQAEGVGAIVETARASPPPGLVVTSVPGDTPGQIGNLLVSDQAVLLAEHENLPSAPHGAGDLTAALLMAGMMRGRPPAEMLAHATGAVRDVLGRAAGRGADELMLAADADCLRHPTATVTTRRPAVA